MVLAKEEWGRLRDGSVASLYTLNESEDFCVKISDYGGTITSIVAPDRDEAGRQVVLGFDDLGGYLDSRFYLGCIVGRYANRISGGRFMIDGDTYQLSRNDGDNHLHGGFVGLDKVLWEARGLQDEDRTALSLHYLSPDGSEGYPGNLNVWVIYSLIDLGLRIEYWAETDQPTIVNLTNHSYFNFGERDDVLGHFLMLNSDLFTPVDKFLIPTGAVEPVEGTPFDFREARRVGESVDEPHDQILMGGGYDHNMILREGNELRYAALLYEEISGIGMEVYTTQPGLQFYSGNFLDGSSSMRNGKPMIRRSGLCLETQHYPDSPNHPNFPGVVLRPGETYNQVTELRFKVM